MTTQYIIPAILIFISGVAEGFRDASIFHTDTVIKKWNLNRRFYDFTVSYLNKYIDRNPAKGLTFRGKYFVFTTDSIHLCKFIQNRSLFLALVLLIAITQNQHLYWWHYIAIFFGCYFFNRLGFIIIWRLF